MDIVEVSAHVPAEPGVVFGWLTDPARHVRWMGARAQLQAEPGGVYHLWWGDGFGVSGTYLEIAEPHRVVFTWGWDSGAGERVLSGPRPDDALPPGSTRVAITLTREPDGTRVNLAHHDLATPRLREDHRIAWQTYLGRLATVLSGNDPGPDPHA